jgi:hypothetical protein
MVKNIRLINPNMTRVSGYFYSFDHQTDTMIQKADDGTLAFAYPLDTPIANTVRSLEFDGESYWTLERITEGTSSDGFRIRRWVIENFVMVLQQTFVYQTNATDAFDSSAFTIERYSGTVVANGASGTPTISVNFGNDHTSVFNLITPGTHLFLGPSTLAGFTGQSQRVTVNSVTVPNLITLTSNKTVGFAVGDSVNFSKNIWFFSQNYLTTLGVGGLYKTSIADGSILSRTQGGAYKDIDACGFHDVESFQAGTALESYNGHYLLFLRTNSLLFIDVLDPQLTVVLSAIQNNINAATTSVFAVSDLGIQGNTLFRLQTQFNINGTESTETTYNYQLATFRPFPTAIALSAVEAIIPAGNATSHSIITATVTDQYALPFITSPASTIQFATSGGGTGSSLSNTGQIALDSNGRATVTYNSGTTAGLVTITATVTIAT